MSPPRVPATCLLVSPELSDLLLRLQKHQLCVGSYQSLFQRVITLPCVAIGAGGDQVVDVVAATGGHRMHVVALEHDLWRSPAAVLAGETVAFEDVEPDAF
jgi:hypothetical protein